MYRMNLSKLSAIFYSQKKKNEFGAKLAIKLYIPINKVIDSDAIVINIDSEVTLELNFYNFSQNQC